MISEDHEKEYIQKLWARLHDKSLANLERPSSQNPSAPAVNVEIEALGWKDIQPSCGRIVTQRDMPE